MDELDSNYNFCKHCCDHYVHWDGEESCNSPFGQITCNRVIKKVKTEICQEYCDFIMKLEELYPKECLWMAGKDFERVEIHTRLCEIFGITHDDCLGITDRLDEIKYNAVKLKELLDGKVKVY